MLLMTGIFRVKTVFDISCRNAANYNNCDTFRVPHSSIMYSDLHVIEGKNVLIIPMWKKHGCWSRLLAINAL